MAFGNLEFFRGAAFVRDFPSRVSGMLGISLDYAAPPSFDVRGNERDDSPSYEAPPAAPPGFTRSPAENDYLICPNCNDELTEGDDDVKRQVWVVRGCGHVSDNAVFWV